MTEFQKIRTENKKLLVQQNNKQKLLILKVLLIRSMQPKLNIINCESSTNVLKFL